MMQFLASSLTHVWSIAAPSYYRQGSTFQTILVTKKHPRQRQAGSRRNFLGLLTNYIVTAAAGKVSRKMALGSADLSPLILPDSPVESLLDQHQLTCVDSGAPRHLLCGYRANRWKYQCHPTSPQVNFFNISEWRFYKSKPNESIFWYLIIHHLKAFLGRD